MINWLEKAIPKYAKLVVNQKDWEEGISKHSISNKEVYITLTSSEKHGKIVMLKFIERGFKRTIGITSKEENTVIIHYVIENEVIRRTKYIFDEKITPISSEIYVEDIENFLNNQEIDLLKAI